MSADIDPLTVHCPRCGAPRGQRCRAMPPQSYHAPRRVLAHTRDGGSEARRLKKLRVAREMLKP